MASRWQPVPRLVLLIAIRQGAVIPCYRCKVPFTEFDCSKPGYIEREDVHELSLDGEQTVENSAWSHGQRHPTTPCHGYVTNGTKATKAGSSKSKKAKVDRLARESRGEPKRKRSKRKIKSKGFNKTVKRPFRWRPK